MVFSNNPRFISSHHSCKKAAPHRLRNVSTITIAISLFSLVVLSAISTLDFGSNASKKVTKVRPTIVRPTKWDTFDHYKMRTYFECSKAFESERPWWTDQEWRIVRELYQDLLKSERAGLVRGSTKIGTYRVSDEVFDFSQIVVPYQAGKEKGRGLKAAKDIRKGDMIFKATNNTVVFTDGHSFRKCMFMLNERFPTFACDVLQWAWVQDLEGGAFGIEVDLDDCNLLNSGRQRSVNIQCGKADEICDGNHFYARRDIKKGEEILGSYSEFVSDHSWSELGL
ncbi:hypothetical protein QTG54_009661 [Skeletonema marinoi]|uniref:SET domain-containing protein n=1 Tax=Skeletonema marinoi TaxID=267567 RepID=A0AAD9DA90_9STRA|nr:hypothetical protein QTG54_009661 [Skeletonema marinoi]